MHEHKIGFELDFKMKIFILDVNFKTQCIIDDVKVKY